MIPSSRQHRKPDFSLATINIVFLLLLFFLSVGTIVDSQEIGVDAPETRELPLDRLPRPLLLINERGVLSLDGRALTDEQLVSVAKNASLSQDGTVNPINILADVALPGRELVETVGRLSLAGVEVRLVTLREASQ